MPRPAAGFGGDESSDLRAIGLRGTVWIRKNNFSTALPNPSHPPLCRFADPANANVGRGPNSRKRPPHQHPAAVFSTSARYGFRTLRAGSVRCAPLSQSVRVQTVHATPRPTSPSSAPLQSPSRIESQTRTPRSAAARHSRASPPQPASQAGTATARTP